MTFGSTILISRLIIQTETYSYRLCLLVGAVHKGLRVVTGVGGQVIAPVYKQYRIGELDLKGQNVVSTTQVWTVFPLHTVRNSAGLDADEASDQHHRHRGNLQQNCHRYCWLQIVSWCVTRGKLACNAWIIRIIFWSFTWYDSVKRLMSLRLVVWSLYTTAAKKPTSLFWAILES